MMISCSPDATASSTTYWMVGLSTRGSISLGCDLVAGRNRVPRPAAGKTAFRTRVFTGQNRNPLDGYHVAMLDPVYLRDHMAEVDAALRKRGLDPSADLSAFQALEAERRRLIPAVETLKRDQNTSGEAVARAKREGGDASAILVENKARGARIKELELELAEVERRRDALMLTLPNLPHESVPAGQSSADNREERRW